MAASETQCGHCGQNGTLDSVKSVVLDSRDETVAVGPGDGDYQDVEYQTLVEVARCRACGQPTFISYDWVSPIFDEPEDAMNVRRIYPPRRDGSDLPDRVRRRYVQMLDMLYAADAFAVRAGRCLEAVCADQGIPGERNGKFVDLSVRLDALVKQGHLPRALGEQAHLVRKYRNLGGHDGDLEPTAADVPLIRDFVEALLEFLYWGPAKLARGNAELKARRAAVGRRPSSGAAGATGS